MIVERWTVRTKPGQHSELIELLKAERERTGTPFRIYDSRFGPHWTVAIEWEYEDLAEQEKSWEDYYAQHPDAESQVKRWFEMIDTGGATEIWTLH